MKTGQLQNETEKKEMEQFENRMRDHKLLLYLYSLK
jgi:hypothetical protein